MLWIDPSSDLLADLLAAVAEDVRQAGQRMFFPTTDLGRVNGFQAGLSCVQLWIGGGKQTSWTWEEGPDRVSEKSPENKAVPGCLVPETGRAPSLAESFGWKHKKRHSGCQNGDPGSETYVSNLGQTLNDGSARVSIKEDSHLYALPTRKQQAMEPNGHTETLFVIPR